MKAYNGNYFLRSYHVRLKKTLLAAHKHNKQSVTTSVVFGPPDDPLPRRVVSEKIQAKKIESRIATKFTLY